MKGTTQEQSKGARTRAPKPVSAAPSTAIIIRNLAAEIERASAAHREDGSPIGSAWATNASPHDNFIAQPVAELPEVRHGH